MLNISRNPISERLKLTSYQSGRRVLRRDHFKWFNRFLGGFAIVCFIVLFLPWTQNVTGRGYVTTLTPDQRPQTIQSPIAGRIEQWFIREGDSVQRGDTIMRISEVKGEYLDTELVQRTEQQIAAKSAAVTSYGGKVLALDQVISSLRQEQQLKKNQARNKLLQARLKVSQDSIDLIAARTADSVAQIQVKRQEQLNQEGIYGDASVEDKRQSAQEKSSKYLSQQQKLAQSRNEIFNAQIELNRIDQEYNEKVAKAQSDQFTAQSTQLDTKAQVSKLQVDRENYAIRNSFYYVTAPQDGFINKAIIGGLGETFKEGAPLINLMPLNYDLAVETFVEPLDLPLMHYGEHVRIQFDGWPAIVFSGWPNATYGTYGATVVAIEQFTNEDGKYRILVAPDPDDHPWPQDLRPGAGARTIALLEDVPVWYEMWRRLNGFPANYYQPENTKSLKDAKQKK